MSYVLIVDDDPDGCEIIHRYLQQSQINSRVSPNGHEALRELLLETPDAIILDVRMPEMDGISLLEVLRSYLRWDQLPVVIVTAHASREDLDRAAELGVSHVFQKSNLKLPELLECLRGIMPPQVGGAGGGRKGT
jgi:CheY-like chemotaxis protein